MFGDLFSILQSSRDLGSLDQRHKNTGNWKEGRAKDERLKGPTFWMITVTWEDSLQIST